MILVFLFLAGNMFSVSIKETRETGHFSKITVSNGIDLYFTQANNQKIEVDTDVDIIRNVITEVKGNSGSDITVKDRRRK